MKTLSIRKSTTWLAMFALGILAFATSCNKDNANGNASFYLTDAPVDDANVEAVFVTVADIKVDGESVDGFNKKTLELSAYQNGKTELLYDDELEASSYNEITLVLDYEKDANGNSPGTYVVTTDGEKQMLSNTSSGMGEFVAEYDLEVKEESSSSVVLDFDLRKAIKRKEGQSSEYELIASERAHKVVRASDREKSSTVEGETEDKSQLGMNGQVVAYLYKKGSFDQNTETSNEVMFENAVSSTLVMEDGSYTFSFIEEGEYELHFANYDDTDNDGTSEFKGMLKISASGSGSVLDNIEIGANADIELNIEIFGLL